MVAGFAGSTFQVLVDLGQRRGAIGARFAGAEQVQVGSVQNQEGRHVLFLVIRVQLSEPGDYAAKPL